MSSSKKKSVFSKETEENIIENIAQSLPSSVNKQYIRNTLGQCNWDLESGLRALCTVFESYKNAQDYVHQPPEATKKPSKKSAHQQRRNSSGQNTKKPDLFQKAPGKRNKKEKDKKAVAQDDWVMVDSPKSKSSKSNKTSKASPTQFSGPQPLSSGQQKKLLKREPLLQNYNIIKHFGEPKNRIDAYIKANIKVMVLLRGCSGSGKSTCAIQMLQNVGSKYYENHIFSADNYFVRSDGGYYFNSDLLSDAHEWNKNMVKQAASEGRSPIFVDNTHTRLWEMKDCALLAVKYGYVLETLEPPTPWFFNEDQLYRKNRHSVPRESIRRMLDRYEANISGDDILKNLCLNYVPPMIPPQAAVLGIDAPLTTKLMRLAGIPLNMKQGNINPTHSRAPTTQKVNKHFYFNPEGLPTTSNPNVNQTGKVPLSNQATGKSPNQTSSYSYSQLATGFQKTPGLQNMQSACAKYTVSLQPDGTPGIPEMFKNLSLDEQKSEDNVVVGPAEDNELISFSGSDSSCSSSSYEDDSEDEQSDTEQPAEPFYSLEYVLVSEDNSITFQKEHDEMKDVLTLEDFKRKQVLFHDWEDISESSFDLNMVQGPSNFNKVNESSTIKVNENNLFVSTSTLTEPEDFQNLLEVEAGTIVKEVKILTGHSRSIVPSFWLPKFLFKSSSVEKCTMTEIFDAQAESGPSKHEPIQNDDQISRLHLMFPNVSKENLIELFGSPLMDIDWAINVLLDSGQEMVDPSIQETTTDNKGNKESELSEETKNHLYPCLESLKEATLNDKILPAGKVNDYLSLYNVQTPSSHQVETIDEKFKSEKCEALWGSTVPNNEITSYTQTQKISHLGDWDFKSQLPSAPPKSSVLPKSQRTSKPKVKISGVDMVTNTNYLDFEIVRQVNAGFCKNDVKVLSGNLGFVSGNAFTPSTSTILMLEKGTMTSDVETNQITKLDSGMERLASMFPRVTRENLQELFEKCQGDIDWAAGLLLDSGQEMSELFTSLEPLENIQQQNTDSLTSPDIYSPEESKEMSLNGTQNSNEQKSKRKRKIRQSKSDHELHKDLQEHIQNNFILDESHYASTKMKQHFQRRRTLSEKTLENETESPEQTRQTLEECGTENIDAYENSDLEDDIVFMMDSDFIFQLQSRFGGLLRRNMIGEQVAVNLPLSLARQLHSYVMDSVHQIIEEEDILTDEDEEYARHLQQQENHSKGVPSLLEIMDEEVALRKSQKEQGNGRSMAGALSKQLLIERFPKMDPSALASILEDTNHSLHQATALLSSAGYSKADIEEPQTVAVLPKTSANNSEKCPLSREEAIKQADAYGDVASQLYEMRKDCLKKSHRAYREGNHSVALYYSDMARWYMERIEKSNSMAARAILSGYEGWTTLDLHFLQVAEAINVLDLFIDEVIRGLIETNKPRAIVYVITGRGIHSAGGRPRLKPAVQSRLTKRDLRFCEQNPGMLKVVITRTALHSYYLKAQ